MSNQKIKIAIQKSGRLYEESIELLKQCSIKINNGKDQLRASATNFPIEVLYLRNSDIPKYVENGVADLGIIGGNLLVESDVNVQNILNLGFSKCRLSIASRKGEPLDDARLLNGKTIATSYPNTLKKWLQKKGISAQTHTIAGSVEIAPSIGLADYICDLVSSGSTLFKNGLEERFQILTSEACLIEHNNLSPELIAIRDKLIFRIHAILTAKQFKYLLMNVPNDKIEKVIEVLPGMKSPTVMKLAKEGWSSVHTVINEDKFWDIIEELKANGAEGILVNPIEKMIL